jgi:hypothetical protein
MLTIIDAGRAVDVDARVEGERVLLSEQALREALGWELHEGTLCNDTMCVPLPAGSSLAAGGALDLAEVADVLDRPLALDPAEGAAYLGASARERAEALASLIAPDFMLPDLAGRPHTLAEHRGKKVLLVVWASW